MALVSRTVLSFVALGLLSVPGWSQDKPVMSPDVCKALIAQAGHAFREKVTIAHEILKMPAFALHSAVDLMNPMDHKLIKSCNDGPTSSATDAAMARALSGVSARGEIVGDAAATGRTSRGEKLYGNQVTLGMWVACHDSTGSRVILTADFESSADPLAIPLSGDSATDHQAIAAAIVKAENAMAIRFFDGIEFYDANEPDVDNRGLGACLYRNGPLSEATSCIYRTRRSDDDSTSRYGIGKTDFLTKHEQIPAACFSSSQPGAKAESPLAVVEDESRKNVSTEAANDATSTRHGSKPLAVGI